MHPLPARRAGDDNGQPGDVGAHTLGHAEGIHRPRLRQQQRELLTTEPPGPVVVPQGVVEGSGELLEYLITGGVPGRTALATSTVASRSQVDAFRRPVFESARESLTSWTCRSDRCSSVT